MRRINENEIEPLSVFVAEQFYYKEQMQLMLKGIEPVKALEYTAAIFRWQLDFMNKHGDVFVNDGDVSGIITGLDSKKKSWRFILHIMLKAMALIYKMFTKEERKIIVKNVKAVNEVTSKDWFKQHCKGSSYYLALFAIGKDSRGTGLCREMLEYLFEHVRDYKSIVLETHDKDNVPLYEHFGFELAEAKEAKDKSITEYRMIKRM